MYNGTPQTGQMLAILFSLDLSNIEKSFKQLNFNVAKFENKFLSFCDFFLFRAAFKFRLRLHLEILNKGVRIQTKQQFGFGPQVRRCRHSSVVNIKSPKSG